MSYFQNFLDCMKYCECLNCDKKAGGKLSLGGIKHYYCLKHLKRVKRRLVGI
ncbi:MAG: hypothetical protein ACUVTD_08120 [Nitrososphaerales archaeon]